jgi:16S rRNA (guanine527-N7)-methyltransferase
VINLVIKYFPSISALQKEKFSALKGIYERWNDMINVISRKDMDNFMAHHVLHSLSIAGFIEFKPGTKILDVGTGGGFPGIPLAIMFPESEFTLLDSVGKKIKVVNAVSEELELDNVTIVRKRVEDERSLFHFVVSRAVTDFPSFTEMTRKNISRSNINEIQNGIICLKGGDLSEELKKFSGKVKIWEINRFFEESYFETKKIVYLPV